MINDSNTEKWEEETKKNPDADEESRKKVCRNIKKRAINLLWPLLLLFTRNGNSMSMTLTFLFLIMLRSMKTEEEVDEYVFLILQRIFEKISVRKIGSSHRVITQISGLY